MYCGATLPISLRLLYSLQAGIVVPRMYFVIIPLMVIPPVFRSGEQGITVLVTTAVKPESAILLGTAVQILAIIVQEFVKSAARRFSKHL